MNNTLIFYGAVLLVWAFLIECAPHKYNNKRERANKVTFEFAVATVGIALFAYAYRENIMVLCAYIMTDVLAFSMGMVWRSIIMKEPCDE